jgi:hypothetical protein
VSNLLASCEVGVTSETGRVQENTKRKLIKEEIYFFKTTFRDFERVVKH